MQRHVSILITVFLALPGCCCCSTAPKHDLDGLEKIRGTDRALRERGIQVTYGSLEHGTYIEPPFNRKLDTETAWKKHGLKIFHGGIVECTGKHLTDTDFDLLADLPGLWKITLTDCAIDIESLSVQKKMKNAFAGVFSLTLIETKPTQPLLQSFRQIVTLDAAEITREQLSAIPADAEFYGLTIRTEHLSADAFDDYSPDTTIRNFTIKASDFSAAHMTTVQSFKSLENLKVKTDSAFDDDSLRTAASFNALKRFECAKPKGVDRDKLELIFSAWTTLRVYPGRIFVSR